MAKGGLRPGSAWSAAVLARAGTCAAAGAVGVSACEMLLEGIAALGLRPAPAEVQVRARGRRLLP